MFDQKLAIILQMKNDQYILHSWMHVMQRMHKK